MKSVCCHRFTVGAHSWLPKKTLLRSIVFAYPTFSFEKTKEQLHFYNHILVFKWAVIIYTQVLIYFISMNQKSKECYFCYYWVPVLSFNAASLSQFDKWTFYCIQFQFQFKHMILQKHYLILVQFICIRRVFLWYGIFFLLSIFMIRFRCKCMKAQSTKNCYVTNFIRK